MAVAPVVIVLTEAGLATGQRLSAHLGAALHGRKDRVSAADLYFDNALTHINALFAGGVPIVGICASGILIRAVAPLLNDKSREPPLLSVSDDGAVVVPLLGGHRGANRLAREIAAHLDAVAAVTTAGDIALGVALDEPPLGWRLANPEAAKSVMAALLAGKAARVSGDFVTQARWLAQLPQGDDIDIICTCAPATADLVYHPQNAVLGLGCSRGCPPQEMADLAERVLIGAGISPGALAAIASVDLKADEPAILDLAKRYQVPLRLFSPAQLEAQTPRCATRSDVVYAEIGTHGVAENAALACAGDDAKLTEPKRKTAHATAALAVSASPITALGGRPRGHLSIIGIGPGQASWRTPEASHAIQRADELVGYGLYIDLLGPAAAGKPRHDYPLGGEEARCRYALERAGEGYNVALICSGDAGIYAMGALVYELLDRPIDGGGVSDAARRIEVQAIPGISALQAAAARVGAPLGHDFCAISLSDLLTPREDIERRVLAAAQGDFVIAFYNPVSKKRRALLREARDTLLAYRPAETPVILASSLGRAEEKIQVVSLRDLCIDDVDMLTLVLVGSSHTRWTQRGTGPAVYTPRGYARKIDGDLSAKDNE